MNIFALIVAYNPNLENLFFLINVLNSQNISTVLIDNNSINKKDLELSPANFNIFLDENMGIAKAQNIGIQLAKEKLAEYVIFFDQDSTIPDNYINNLMDDYKQLENQGLKIGAIGPRFIDDRHGFYYKTINLSKFGFRKKMDVSKITQPIHSSLLISSGSLISVETLKNVGLMRENYFIDYVDTEWCIRAEATGYKNYMSSKAVMRHTIGDKILRFGFFNVPVHSPFRRYYRVRNAIFMFKEPHIPFLLFFREMIFNFLHQLILVLSEKDKKAYINSYIKGIRDGFSNR